MTAPSAGDSSPPSKKKPSSFPAKLGTTRAPVAPASSDRPSRGKPPYGGGDKFGSKGKPPFKKSFGKPYGPPRGPGGPGVPRGSGGPGGPGGPRPYKGVLRRDAASFPQGIRVVHEDADVLVIDKPSGLLTAGQIGEARITLFDMVKRYIRSTRPRPRRRKASDPDAPRTAGQGAYIIHRLDKEASGLLVFATSDKAFGWLKDDFKAKRVHRIYLALVEGSLGEAGTSGTVQSFIREDHEGSARSIAPEEYRGPGPGGLGGASTEAGQGGQAKLAVTHYRVVAAANGLSLIQVRLETGRKNQIRIHMADKGCPLAGDFRHGAKTNPVNRVALHASELGFTHPGTGQTVRYFSPAPDEFYKAVGMKPSAVKPSSSPPPPPFKRPPAGTTAPASPATTPVAPAAPAAGVAKAPSPPPSSSKPSPKHTEVAGEVPHDTSWDNVAEWYDTLLDEKRSDHYEQVIIPGTIRLTQPAAGQRILDVACGQGIISRALASLGASVTGIDAAPALIAAAQSRSKGQIEYHVCDARELAAAALSPSDDWFDSATCVMALSNIEPLEPVFKGVAALLKPGGSFVCVISHPAFRAVGQTSWGWDDERRKQFRRIEGYLSNGQAPIQMHPGSNPDVTTWTFHRPLQTYVRLLSEAGLLIDSLEEWAGRRVSEPGPRAGEENRARREIPLFLAWRAIKVR